MFLPWWNSIFLDTKQEVDIIGFRQTATLPGQRNYRKEYNEMENTEKRNVREIEMI